MWRFYTVNDSIVLYRINCVHLKVDNSFCWLYDAFRSVGLEIEQPAEIKGSQQDLSEQASRASLFEAWRCRILTWCLYVCLKVGLLQMFCSHAMISALNLVHQCQIFSYTPIQYIFPINVQFCCYCHRQIISALQVIRVLTLLSLLFAYE